MKKYYFQVKYGFNADDYLSIEYHELEKATFAHLTGAVVAFDSGSVSGKNIIVIKEDFVRAMGWNKGYQLTPEDNAEIEIKCKDYKGLVASMKEKVQYLINTNQTNLIGKGFEMPKQVENSVSEMTKSLAEKMKLSA